MICYDRLWKNLIDNHMNKMELRDRTVISTGKCFYEILLR